MNFIKHTFTFLAFVLLSFTVFDKEDFDINYPNPKKTTITTKLTNFKNFTKEWRGTDYYYYAMSADSIICSVLYYKLNKGEQKQYVDLFGGMTNSGIPFATFLKTQT